MTEQPAALWEHLVQWQPATAAAIAQHVRALPEDWPARTFGVARVDAALVLPPAATGEQFPDRAPEIAPYDEIASPDDCPACEESAGTCRFHAGYAAGHHEQAQALREAVKARPDIGLREFMLWQADVDEAADRGEEPPVLPAAPSAVQPPADRAAVLHKAADRLAQVADELADTQESPRDAFSLTRPVIRDAECWHAAARELRRLADEAQPECRASLSGHCLREAQSESACDTEAGECLYGGRPADEAQQTAPAAAYGDGKGRVYCLGCASAVAASVPLTADDVDHWELCPTCGRHVVEVARATAETQQPAEPEPTQLRWGLNDVMWGDDDTITVMLSGPAGEPYWLELEPERAAVLREDLSGPDGAVPPPALTEEGRLAARVNVLEETVERARQLADTGAKCLRVNHQGQIEGARVTAEGWRFALSTALDLGTSAPWDAIHDRVKQLHRKTDGEAQR